MNGHRDWKERLTEDLEPALALPDPRPRISAYDNLPFAIFLYPPREHFALQEEVGRLATRLGHEGKRVTDISLSECLWAAIENEGLTVEELAQAERENGWEALSDTLLDILRTTQPLDELVLERIPHDADPKKDVVFLTRAGALFPFHRTSTLLNDLHGRLEIPAVLFYPGTLVGPAGLSFMGKLEPEHNYRPKIF